MYPDADVPAFQVSLPSRLDGDRAWALRRRAGTAGRGRCAGDGSESLTHNLAEFRAGVGSDEAYAVEFAYWVRDAIVQGDSACLRQTLAQAPHAMRAHPTAEHFWPLLVAAGAATAALPVTVIDGGIPHGMLSMDAFVFGTA